MKFRKLNFNSGKKVEIRCAKVVVYTAYLILSIPLFVIVFFYGGGGDGSYVPYAIFFGPFSIPFFALPNPIFFFLGPVLQSLYHSKVFLKILRQKKNGMLIKPLITHLIGSVIALLICSLFYQESELSKKILIEVCAISALGVAAYIVSSYLLLSFARSGVLK